MASHLFRNVRISSINATCQEAGVVVRLHIRSEIMPDVAEAMGWEVIAGGDVVGGINGTGLLGEIALQKATFQPNGMSQHNIAVDASEARDFKLVVTGKTEEDNGKPELRFVVVFPAGAYNELTKYYLAVGGGDAVMHLHTTGETAPLFDEATTAAQDGPEQTLASATSMGKGRKPKVQ